MQLRKVVLFLVPWAIFSSPALAQTGDEIIDRALQALSGEGALETTRSVEVEATASFVADEMSLEASLRYITVRPDKFRIEISFADVGMQMVLGTDGKEFWTSAGDDVTDFSSEQIPQLRKITDSVIPGLSFENLRNAGAEFEYLGRETLRDIEVHHVRCEVLAEYAGSGPNEDIDWYFSVETGLPLASVIRGTAGMASTWSEDYREVGLFRMPFRWELEFSDQGVITVIVQNVQINKPVDPNLFMRPQ